MERTRRNVLSNATKLSAVVSGLGATSTVAAAEYPEWDPDTVYTSGDRVVHAGSAWEANWWTRGNEPGADGEWGPWEQLDSGDDGTGSGLSASIAVSDSSPGQGQDVTFRGTDSSGDPVSYEWALGDGTTATGDVITHAYEADGNYEVTLTVENAAGESDSTTTTIRVGERATPSIDGTFAPYQGTWGDIVGGTVEAGTDHVFISFVGDATADGEVNPGWLTGCGGGSCDQQPLSRYESEIQTLQDRGIEVWLSIGGWQSRTVARDADDPTELKTAYETILDTFGATHLDIDDENARNRPDSVYEIRNDALAMLQDERPEVTVGYTVPAGRNGIENRDYSPARDMVRDAVESGVDLSYVNIMTMGFNPTTPALIESACEGTVEWLGEVYPNKSAQERWAMLGNTPNINESGFTPDSARQVVDFATEKGIGLLSFWALYHDSGGSFSSVYSEFESGA